MKLHSTILGEGKPFLILHGFLGMGDNWKTLGKKFSDLGYEVHLLDQRNHGKSPHSEEMSYTEMSQDVKEYCDEHALQDVVILGHSMGGKTAMWASTFFPDLFERLIVVDIAPKYYPPHHQQILSGLEALRKAELTSRSQAEEILGNYVQEPGVKMFLLKNLYWESKGKLALRLNLEILTSRVDAVGEALPEGKVFTKATLFIKGATSDYIREEDKAAISSYFPSSRVISIPDAGHWVHAEEPEVFFSTVKDFLEEN